MANDVMRFRLHRDLRKICQDYRRATPRSTGARAAVRAPVGGLLGEGEFLQGLAFDAGAHPGAAALVGEVGQNGDALALADAGESHSSRPPGSVTTRTFTPCRRCLWE